MAVNVKIDSKIDKIFSNFKRLTPALVAVAIGSGFVLFLPESLLKAMALDEIPHIWKTILGIVFIASLSLIVTIIFSEIFSSVKKKYLYSRYIKRKRNELEKLSDEQFQIVTEILYSKEKACKYNPYNGDIKYLQDRRFIYQADPIISYGPGYAYPVDFAPHPWLLDLYKQEPALFQYEDG